MGNRFRRERRLWLPSRLITLVLATAACGDSTAPDAVVGTYTLHTVNDQVLPYVLFDLPASRVEITGASITFSADGRFALTENVREVQGSAATTTSTTSSGNWARDGNRLRLIPDRQGREFDIVQVGNTLTVIVIDGPIRLVLSFRRQ